MPQTVKACAVYGESMGESQVGVNSGQKVIGFNYKAQLESCGEVNSPLESAIDKACHANYVIREHAELITSQIYDEAADSVVRVGYEVDGGGHEDAVEVEPELLVKERLALHAAALEQSLRVHGGTN